MSCLAPITLVDGQQVACRNCWQCKLDRIDDWVGRCIAERQTSVGCHAVTLTYARDLNEKSTTYGEAEHERAAVLTYSDVQIFLKRLRNWGYPMRYVIAGEYGSLKGRAHWHLILFWTKRVPIIPRLQKRELFWNIDPETKEVRLDHKGAPLLFWDWGATYWDKPEYEHFRYNVKYIQKDEKDPLRQGHFVMSKKPPIGARYFFSLARNMARHGVAPQNAGYSWPDVVKKNGERRKFFMHGNSADRFAEAFVNCWFAIHGTRHMPQSDFIEKWLDSKVDLDLYRPAFEEFRRMPNPLHDTVLSDDGDIRLPIGFVEAKKRGIKIDYAKHPLGGIEFSEYRSMVQTETSGWFIMHNGRKLVWRQNDTGGWSWHDLKAEIAHKKFLALYAQAAERARQEGRPSLVKLGEKPRRHRKRPERD